MFKHGWLYRVPDCRLYGGRLYSGGLYGGSLPNCDISDGLWPLIKFIYFAVNESQLKHKFSVIGLAETNVEPCNKDLFGLNDYTCDYQDTNSSKFKGTGVALYIHNCLKATRNTALCKTTPDFESLFVTAVMGSKKVTIGVTYNPSSGENRLYLNELEKILKNCPK